MSIDFHEYQLMHETLNKQQNLIKELEKENKLLREGLELISRGSRMDMPDYFIDIAENILEQIDKGGNDEYDFR